MGTGAIAIATALAIGIPAIGSALGQGLLGSKAMDGMARQPEAAGKIQTAMILGLAFIEALTIYGLLIAFMLLGKF